MLVRTGLTSSDGRLFGHHPGFGPGLDPAQSRSQGTQDDGTVYVRAAFIRQFRQCLAQLGDTGRVVAGIAQSLGEQHPQPHLLDRVRSLGEGLVQHRDAPVDVAGEVRAVGGQDGQPDLIDAGAGGGVGNARPDLHGPLEKGERLGRGVRPPRLTTGRHRCGQRPR
jgi:hypothetical protein